MARILIATFYAHEPITVSAAKLGVDKIVLLIDNEPDKKQQEALEIIKKSVGPIVETVKSDIYDIVAVAKVACNIIDRHQKDELYVNVTAGRKTKALGLLYACYMRDKWVNKIIYITEEDKKMIILPKLSFNLKPTELKVLEHIEKKEIRSITDSAAEIDVSKSMLYSNLDELKNKGLIEETKEKEYILTDAGRIALL
jgi:CRISPR-associated protein Csa3